MENSQTMRLTNDVASLAQLNRYNENYAKYSGPFNENAVAKDFELLMEYSKAFQKRLVKSRPSVGDCLHLPDGQKVYFCHVYSDRAQTCETGSFHLSNTGYISYSGGLDRGITLENIELTNDKSILPVWFCHRGHLTGGCAIYAFIECRIWKTREGADLSGIPQVKRLRRKRLKEQSEVIAKVNGNGGQYSEHLPEIVIIKKGLPEDLFEIVQQTTGLHFEDDCYFVPVHWCQPMTLTQLEKLKGFSQFSIRVDRDTLSYTPILVLEIKAR